jgi:hypothetical protein
MKVSVCDKCKNREAVAAETTFTVTYSEELNNDSMHVDLCLKCAIDVLEYVFMQINGAASRKDTAKKVSEVIYGK